MPEILESFVHPKNEHSECGDRIVVSDDYLAVIDGATSKGAFIWTYDGKEVAGDHFVALVIENAIKGFDSDLSHKEAFVIINKAIQEAYINQQQKAFEEMPVNERLQASIIIYSVFNKEIWCYGDCRLMIDNEEKTTHKENRVESLLSEVRAAYIELQADNTLNDANDYGREKILPMLSDFMAFANTDGRFGYYAVNGGRICEDQIYVFPVKPESRVVMSTDGYPKLFPTYNETEEYLKDAIKKDPKCINLLVGTKGVLPGNESYDDRSYLSFIV